MTFSTPTSDFTMRRMLGRYDWSFNVITNCVITIVFLICGQRYKLYGEIASERGKKDWNLVRKYKKMFEKQK